MKKTKRILCLFLVIMLLSLTACSSGTASFNLKEMKIEGSVNEKNKTKSLYTEKNKREDLIRISRTDMTVLYFDKENYSVSVYDSNGRYQWNSLPEKYTDGTPAVLSVDVFVGKKKITLNSQDDSVKKGLASYEIDGNEILVTYKFESYVDNSRKISFAVPVKYIVADGTMTVSVDCSKIRNADSDRNIIISGIRLLDYFGSSTSGQDGDFIFVPDGCGAVIDTSKNAKEFKSVSVPVYAADLASDNKSKTYATVAAYGIKSADSAFVALVEKGDAICKINASKALKKSSYNRVGAYFEITKTKVSDDNVYASQKAYTGQIKMTFRFLSGENATYAAMASACRETLIRNGTLSLQSSQTSEEYPFVLSLIGCASADGEKSKIKTFTNFEEAQEIISFFRSKGISNIALKYRGMFDGKLLQRDAKKTEISSELGDKDVFTQFSNFTKLQNIRVYPEISYLCTEKSKIKKSALSINGEKITDTITGFKGNVVSSTSEAAFKSLSGLNEQTNALLFKLENYSLDGICLSDAGRYLYADYSSNDPIDRQEASEIMANQINSMSARKSVMVDTGNIYSIKYADFVVNLPNTSSLSSMDYITAVPFLQILLHGIVPYSGKAVNLCSNSETAVLRAAQFGEILSYEFYYQDSESKENETDNLYYMNFSYQAQSSYERLSSLFEDLSSKPITNHYLVKKGVYCTEFGGTANVYVNYNNKDVKVNGVTVEARSFLKVE